jgi:hypothetical protein
MMINNIYIPFMGYRGNVYSGLTIKHHGARAPCIPESYSALATVDHVHDGAPLLPNGRFGASLFRKRDRTRVHYRWQAL